MISLKRYSILTLCALLSVFAAACGDDEDEPTPDTTAPVITIISPQNNATINIPGPVTVEGTIEEAGELQRLEVELSGSFPQSPVTRSILKGEDGFPTKSGNIYAINVTEMINIDPPFSVPITIKLEAEDAAGNIGTETLNVTLR